MAAFGRGGFSGPQQYRGGMGKPTPAAPGGGNYSAYAPGQAQPIQPRSSGAQYSPGTAMPAATPAPAAPPPADAAGDRFNRYYDLVTAENSRGFAGGSPGLVTSGRQQQRAAWDRMGEQNQEFRLQEAMRRAPGASRANPSGFGYSDYTDPATGEKFLADKDGRLKREDDLVNHLSSNPDPRALARQAASYHDRGMEVPAYLRRAANNVQGKSPNAWYSLRYLDRGNYDSDGDAVRQNIRNGT